MAKAEGKPRLVQVDSLPPKTRRSIYQDLVSEFATSKMAIAKIEGSKPTALPSIKKAVFSAGEGKVEVVVRNGEVYLTKK